MRTLFTILIVLFSCSAYAQKIYKESGWEERDKWQEASKFIDELGLNASSNVADIGCHEGYMTVKLAGVVNEGGMVYAVDINEYRLTKLREHLKERNISNVTVIHGAADNPKLPTNKLDAVLIMDTYHEMDDHMEILRHVMQSLKPGGRLVIAEAIAEDNRDLSRADQESKHEIHIKYVCTDLEKAGYKILMAKDPFLDRTKPKGDKMWILVAQKPG